MPSKSTKSNSLRFIKDLLSKYSTEASFSPDALNALEEIQKTMQEKRYGLVWEKHLHPEAVEEAMKTQIPVFLESGDHKIELKPGDKFNFILEGDNLHSLHILEKTHFSSIDLIFIDPPYNTGNNTFKYNDCFVDNNDSYKHSKWLSFMDSRLKIAKNLLTTNGSIFISISDEEYSELKLLMDEIFGAENFIGTLIWRKKTGGGQQEDTFVTEHDYILGYRRSKQFEWVDDSVEREYTQTDLERGYKLTKFEKWGSSAHKEDRETMYFPITDPDGNDFFPVAPDGLPGRWRVGKERLDAVISDGLIEWEKKNDRWTPYEKTALDFSTKKVKERSILYDLATNTEGDKLLTEIFGQKDVFNNPKPIELIEFLIKHTRPKNVLDFFAGSGTTGHAVLDWNYKNDDNVSFILATNNEENIAQDVTFERLRRVMTGYTVTKKISKEIKTYKPNLSMLKSASEGNTKALQKLFAQISADVEDLRSNFDKIEQSMKDGIIKVSGTIESASSVVGLQSNLKYFQTAFVQKNLFPGIELEDELLAYVRPLIELQFGVDLNNSAYELALSEEQLDELFDAGIENKSVIFIRQGVFLSADQQNQITKHNIQVNEIPNYYFGKDMWN